MGWKCAVSVTCWSALADQSLSPLDPVVSACSGICKVVPCLLTLRLLISDAIPLQSSLMLWYFLPLKLNHPSNSACHSPLVWESSLLKIYIISICAIIYIIWMSSGLPSIRKGLLALRILVFQPTSQNASSPRVHIQRFQLCHLIVFPITITLIKKLSQRHVQRCVCQLILDHVSMPVSVTQIENGWVILVHLRKPYCYMVQWC